MFSMMHIYYHIYSFYRLFPCLTLYIFAMNNQATNIEYEEHKGRIAIGRLHAGVLERGVDVRVITPLLFFLSSLLLIFSLEQRPFTF